MTIVNVTICLVAKGEFYCIFLKKYFYLFIIFFFSSQSDDRLLAPGSALSIGEGEIEGKASQSANYEFGGPGDDYLRGGDGEDVQVSFVFTFYIV